MVSFIDKESSGNRYLTKMGNSADMEKQMEDITKIQEPFSKRARIKVLGIGGGGGNAINNMIQGGLDGVEFIAANTDFQVLEKSLASQRIQLGVNLTKGLGAGGNPEMGSKAAQEDIEKIRKAVEGSDMVFITAGLGGGTGTGGAPVVAEICREIDALTVAVVTKPFSFEGRMRQQKADEGLKALEAVVDTLITIPNNRLLCLADKRATVLEMFRRADDVLLFAVKGISDLIVHPGYINVDFADLKTVMGEKGLALMGTGMGTGEGRAAQAAQQAISSPLLEDISIHGAKAALINITTGENLGMHEFEEVNSLIQKEMDDHANIFIGMALDPAIGEEVRVTVIATGIGKVEQPHKVGVAPRVRRSSGDPVVPDLNYDYLQVPTVVRQSSPRDQRQAAPEDGQPRRKTFLQKLTGPNLEEEDLRIPTFIRRQAD